MTAKVHNPQIAAIVAENIRKQRLNGGMSQIALGKALGVTYQQVGKYESAENRVTVDALYLIAEVLKVHVASLLPRPNRVPKRGDFL